MIAVPAMMQDMVAAAQQQQQQAPQLSNLRRLLVGAGRMSQQLQAAVAQLFPNAHLSTAYGMTEGSSSITFITLHGQQRRMASAAAAAGVCVGWPGPGIAVRIDPAGVEQQHPLPLPSSSNSGSNNIQSNKQQQQQASMQQTPLGEVCTCGPHVMQGYWQAADATAAAFTPDGWLRTGDLGYLDSGGCLWLLGRAKDMIKTGGENVHAAEVEAVVLRHPGVAAAAVVGLPHPRLGEQVAAGVVLKQGWTWGTGSEAHEQKVDQPGQQPCVGPQQQQQQCLSQAILQQHCRSAGLSPYKLPRVVVLLQALPLNSSGKVVKAVIRQQILHRQQLQQQQQQSVEQEALARPLGSAHQRSRL